MSSSETNARWRTAQVLFFSAGIALIIGVLYFCGKFTITPFTEALGFIVAMVAFLSTIATLGGLQKYPKLSYGRTSVFLLTFYILIYFLLTAIVRVDVIWESVAAAYCGMVMLFIIWSLVVRYVKEKTFLVVPGGQIEKLLQRLDGKFEFEYLANPDFSTLINRNYHAIVLDTKQALPKSWVQFVTEAQLRRLYVISGNELVEKYAGRIALSHLDETMITQFSPGPLYRVAKRVLDLIIVIITFPFVILIMAILSVIIRAESAGAAIFRQPRIGERGKEFVVYKFRSMLQDAEADGPRFAFEDDSRVTRVGRFIRQFRIDEIPQFVNILRGEMSLIGPRPEQVQMVERFKESIPYYSYRHMVKPGITGWAQVTHGYTADQSETEVKLEHDLYYIKHYSVWLDLLIAIKTIRTIVTGFGAR